MTMTMARAPGLTATNLGAMQRQTTPQSRDLGSFPSGTVVHSLRTSIRGGSTLPALSSPLSTQASRTRLSATIPLTRPFPEAPLNLTRHRHPCAPARVGVGSSARASASAGEGPGGPCPSSDEARWLREEQRWVREEQRWVREEQRWAREREQLLGQIQILREALASTLGAQAPAPPPPLLAREGSAIDVEVQLRAMGLDAPSSPSAPFLPSSTAVSESAAPPTPSSPTPAAAAVSVPSAAAAGHAVGAPKASPGATSRRTLRVGTEGSDVKEMHNALALEGFYCGEEDIEFEMFAEGTDRAVKAWQSTIDAPEDGVMTPALLARLLGEDTASDQGAPPAYPTIAPASPKAGPPPAVARESASAGAGGGAAVNGITPTGGSPTRDRPEIERFARSSIEQGERRVYLLGENRWEEPSRVRLAAEAATAAAAAAALEASEEASSGGVSSRGGVTSRAVNGVVNVGVAAAQKGAKGGGLKLALTQCFECRGVGRVTCLECEGTGELNIEEQFLEWAGEDAHCLYCDGVGAIACDVCDGLGTE